jgi:hypothetical protein
MFETQKVRQQADTYPDASDKAILPTSSVARSHIRLRPHGLGLSACCKPQANGGAPLVESGQAITLHRIRRANQYRYWRLVQWVRKIPVSFHTP